MYFRDPKKELPKDNKQQVVFKYSYYGGPGNKVLYEGYQIGTLQIKDNILIFLDDGCGYYKLDEVIGWMPISELNSIEIK